MGKDKKKPKHEQHQTQKQIRIAEQPEGYYKKCPSWSFSKIDEHHPKWGLYANRTSVVDVISKLKSFESLTWNTIFTKDTRGKTTGTANHPISVTDIAKEAQKRLSELKIFEYDELISLRCTNKLRIWGIIESSGLLQILWIDPNHEICPSTKKYT